LRANIGSSQSRARALLQEIDPRGCNAPRGFLLTQIDIHLQIG